MLEFFKIRRKHDKLFYKGTMGKFNKLGKVYHTLQVARTAVSVMLVGVHEYNRDELEIVRYAAEEVEVIPCK